MCGELSLLQKYDLELIWKLVTNQTTIETADSSSSKAMRMRINQFKKFLQSIKNLMDRLLLLLHRFYFDENCDQFLADLNYTHRQLVKLKKCHAAIDHEYNFDEDLGNIDYTVR